MSKLDARVIARMAKDRRRRDIARLARVRKFAADSFDRRVREEFEALEASAPRSGWRRLWV